MVSLREIEEASNLISDIVKRTPLWYSRAFSSMAGRDVFLKMENLQRTGSFKVRGALNKILRMSSAERARGVVAASAGNHAQGVALAAAMVGVKATVVMPEAAPMSKIMATRGYGAEVVVHGHGYDEAYEKALDIRDRTAAAFVHPFDDPDIIAGQGTAGLEIAREVDGPFTLVCPVGGGGLISGLSLAVKESTPGAAVVGVQAEGACAFFSSRARGEIVTADRARTIADGIAVRTPGRLPFEITTAHVDDLVTVTDDQIAGAILFLLERGKVLAEGAGAAPAAAVMAGKVRPENGPLVLFISGGNMDVSVLSRIIERGLVKTGRLSNIAVLLDDRPGALAALLGKVAASGANVISVNHDRLKAGTPVGGAEVVLSLETRDSEHASGIMRMLRSDGYRIAPDPGAVISQENDPHCGIIPEEVRP